MSGILEETQLPEGWQFAFDLAIPACGKPDANKRLPQHTKPISLVCCGNFCFVLYFEFILHFLTYCGILSKVKKKEGISVKLCAVWDILPVFVSAIWIME